MPEICQRSITAPSATISASPMNARISGAASRNTASDSASASAHKNSVQNRSSRFSFSRSRAPNRKPNSGTPPKEKPTSIS